MDLLIAQLDKKYSAFLRKLDNNSSFNEASFNSAFEYFCITESQSEIKKIIENDRLEIGYKKDAVIFKNSSEDDQKDIMSRIEKNSLSFCYEEILRDMYIPMMKYKKSYDLLTPKDITGNITLRHEKFFNFMSNTTKCIAKFFHLTDRKDSDIDVSVAIGKIEYTFNQEKYHVYMSRIHSALTQQLLEIHTQKSHATESSKIHIIIDSKKGIYQANNDKRSYKIDKISKRLKLIKYLAIKDNCRIWELEGFLHQTKSSIITAIAGINKKFRESTDLVEDLVIHIDTGGYSLNKDVFDIEILE